VVNECSESELGPIESLIEQASGVDLQFVDSDEPISADRRQKQITVYAFTQSAKNETEVELQVSSLSNKRYSDTQVDKGLMAGVIP